MKRLLFIGFLVTEIASAIAATQAPATHLIAGPRSTVVLIGTSNVAAWRCTGTTMTASMEVAASLEKINDVIDRVESGDIGIWMADPAAGRFPAPAFSLEVPVRTFRCTGGKPMEADMQKALRAERSPTIRFLLQNLRGAVTHDIDSHSYQGSVAGQLSLAGTTRDINIEVKAQRLARNRFRLSAKLPLHMSDFGIKPPTAFFGMVKASDALLVRFDLTLIQTQPGS